ncbi:hypothetical protein [Roseiflexus castenholzii]|jgi:hypothetical protein|uniref:CRISPR type III-B/RAMP module-associated protein Cmr5 n=1 Tax=Roseiflexus castenholzii (strain DSM 13941 / HLO8) TaxID=383372 RepID=A7NRS0_ROSCS|nr:hypothetical protein [Roseiflexus castenholzii]ABU60266.1 conserved hypothetical protein [Roseiflexus castenholzii DSM 13941]
MSNSTERNLDRLAAEYAQNIIKRTKDKKASDIDNTITKALGVLQENGVYACFLYLLAREKENGSVVVEEMLNVLNGLGFGWGKPADKRPEKVLAHVSDKVTADLERLLLAKETLEQMLIYARYGAKARE